MGVQVNKSGNSNKDGIRRNNQNRGHRERRDSGNQNQLMGHDANRVIRFFYLFCNQTKKKKK